MDASASPTLPDRDTILYVDDEELARKYFAKLLGSEYTVLTATDPDAAVALLAQAEGRIGVVVTDFRMPGRDGASLLRQLSRDFPQVVQVLVTAHADKGVLVETINSGDLYRVIEKPYDLALLRSTVRLAAEKARERRLMS